MFKSDSLGPLRISFGGGINKENDNFLYFREEACSNSYPQCVHESRGARGENKLGGGGGDTHAQRGETKRKGGIFCV